MKQKTSLVRMADGRNLLVPFLLITTLFFLWGFAHSILDVLNKHFQDALGINKTKSALVQAVVYSGYFLMALPAGEIIRRFGYSWSTDGFTSLWVRSIVIHSGRRNKIIRIFLIFTLRHRLWIDLSGNGSKSIRNGFGRKKFCRT